MLASDLAAHLRHHADGDETALVSINHTDSMASMYGTVLVTQCIRTTIPGVLQHVLLLISTASCSPDDDNTEAEHAMLAHPDLLPALRLAELLDRTPGWSVFHCIQDHRHTTEVYADETEVWDSHVLTTAGPRVSQVDLEDQITYPLVLELWNGHQSFSI